MWAITLPKKIKGAFRSIRLRFAIAYLLIFIFAFLTVTAALVQLVGEYLFTCETDKRLAYVHEILPRLNEAYAADDGRALYDLCMDYTAHYGGRMILMEKDCRVRMDTLSLKNGAYIDVPINKEHSSIVSGDEAEIWRYGEDGVFSLCVVPYEGGALAAVCGAGDAFMVIYDICRSIAVVSLAVLAVSILLSVLLSRKFTHPVKELTTAIGKLSEGDFSVRAKEEGNNEFTDLARAFNEMTGRMEVLDRSRNQFVSNASHELKTPMTTIKILVQNLQYQPVYDPDMTAEFLGDIDKEIDRLTAVVGDLLTLVGMDSGETKLKNAVISLTGLLKADVKRLSPLARTRGIELETELKDEIEIFGDETKLDQVFYNLIDNAIKYTPRGRGVKVEAYKANKYAVVKVCDEGIGIPESDLKHIFDRFYRVDKARSRATGGTGLGLSIVKQIILAHKGTITVASKEKKGSTFTVQLPLGQKSTGGKDA